MKLFNAIVVVESKVEIAIQAEDEEVARKSAKELALGKFPENSRVTNAELILTAESELHVGSKIRHKIFGVGVIKHLKASVNGNNDTGWQATIEFEEQGIKDIVLMPGKQLLEPMQD